MPPATLPVTSAILSHLPAELPELERQLRALVQQESPSDVPAAVNAAADLVQQFAAPLAPRVKRYRQRHFGDVLELRFGPARSRQKPLLLLGHLDTVWPLGTLATMPLRIQEGALYGPGVLDMKAGVAMALAALRTLAALQIRRPVTLLLVSDEEIGSTVSRPITERLALAAQAVLVLEPAQGLACKTARKGVGHYELHVSGVAAHAGVDFERGHSAVRELARLVETVAGMTDLKRGLTVNPGVIAGGTRSNVVAAEAHAEID
ncbi:MAG: M20/M25/M40 family metallo-hydrolase, partial [Acidobacteriota bacterium]|nr:M20/M25/M40 family metallo-hydrolase [Acidobacteriota bacterium]